MPGKRNSDYLAAQYMLAIVLTNDTLEVCSERRDRWKKVWMRSSSLSANDIRRQSACWGTGGDQGDACFVYVVRRRKRV